MTRQALAGIVFAGLMAGCTIVTGCASAPPQPKPGVYPGRLPEIEQGLRPLPVSEGSLYTEQGSSELVGDFRGRHLGDVIIVRITENALATASADSQLDKKSSNSLKAPTPLGFGNKLKGKLGPDFDPALAFATENSQNFDGKGATSRKNQLTATMAVRVMAIGVGGQMVVAGTKDVTVNREHHSLTLAGIVRPEDVAADDTIGSGAIADLTVKYGGTGDVSEMTRQGWFTKLLSKVWPF